jgi:hypothetical protein
MLLELTTDTVELIRSSTADLEVAVDWTDLKIADNTISGAGTQTAKFTTAATSTICTAPASGDRRSIKLTIRNKHASASNDVTVQKARSGPTVYEQFKCTLLAQEELRYDGKLWARYDSAGGLYGNQLPIASDVVQGAIEIASQAEMEAGTDTTRAVTPGRQHFHPSGAKFWAQITGGGSPSLTTNYNVASIADTGTGRMTVTIATDFGSANWCCNATTFTSTTTGDEGICNIDSKAAGTVEIGNRIVTPAFGDPAVGYDVLGYGDQA